MKKPLKIALIALASITVVVVTFLLLNKFTNLFKTNNNTKPTDTSSIISQPDDTSSTPVVPTENLTFSAPKYETFTTDDASVTFTGVVENGAQLLLNDEEIAFDESGNFTKTIDLKYGKNTFTFKIGKVTKTFTITRRYVVMKEVSPSTSQTYSSGGTVKVSALARDGATVTAKFNGKTITLTQGAATDDGFATFTGSFSLPTGHYVDMNMGKIIFKGVHNGFSQTLECPRITCKRNDLVVDYDPDATPSGGNYINVGSGIICEIVAFQAETFNGNDSKDTSRPYNNYLPEGTVDYCKAALRDIDDESGRKLVTMRFGKQVYLEKRRSPYNDFTAVAKQYVGTLPDHNELSVASFGIDGHHTTLVLDTDWKAPFIFELKDQKYNSNFTVDNVTFNYVDITFCYATVFDETNLTIDANHPLFSGVKVIKNESDYTLRFYLKKQGAFYGWDAYYNDKNQLCFEFLNPTKVTVAENEYGADLTGAVILIDVGHGGKTDTGSCNGKQTEKQWNLTLAKAIKRELESIGATVHLTRSTDVEQLSDYKMKLLKDLKPDYCIAIHHDGNKSTSLNGFGSYYYQPYSKAAAQIMQTHNSNLTVNGKKVYKSAGLKWHYYFMGRVSVCPVVLTENGYMTNKSDLSNITNMTVNDAKAKAITAGIAEYFLSIQ